MVTFVKSWALRSLCHFQSANKSFLNVFWSIFWVDICLVTLAYYWFCHILAILVDLVFIDAVISVTLTLIPRKHFRRISWTLQSSKGENKINVNMEKEYGSFGVSVNFTRFLRTFWHLVVSMIFWLAEMRSGRANKREFGGCSGKTRSSF